MTIPLQDATALTERIQDMLHHAPDNAPEVAIYTEAILHLHYCCDALARLPEPQYRMLEEGETIKSGDEILGGGVWLQCFHSIGQPLFPGYCVRRPIPTAQDFRDIEGFLTRCNSVYAQGLKQEEKA